MNSDGDSKAVFSNFGLPAEIPCQFSGHPTATVNWFLNGRNLEADLQVIKFHYVPLAVLTRWMFQCCPNNPPLQIIPETNALRITQVSETSGGVYQCEVSNPASSVISSTWLKPQGTARPSFSF